MLFIYSELSLKEREQVLTAEATVKETRNYQRSLQDSEVEFQEKNLARDMMAKHEEEEKLKNIKAEYADKLKNIDERIKERLDKIKNRKVTVTGTLWGKPNYENNRMLFYDKYGELVDSRDLLPTERQGNVFQKTNAALTDLPLETQSALAANGMVVYNGSNNQQPVKQEPTVDGQGVEIKEFTHDEAGWSKMSPEQLQEKYGTYDMLIIPKMVQESGGTWAVPIAENKEDSTKAKGKGKKK